MSLQSLRTQIHYRCRLLHSIIPLWAALSLRWVIGPFFFIYRTTLQHYTLLTHSNYSTRSSHLLLFDVPRMIATTVSVVPSLGFLWFFFVYTPFFFSVSMHFVHIYAVNIFGQKSKTVFFCTVVCDLGHTSKEKH